MKADDVKVSFINLTEENKKYVTELLVDLILMVQDLEEDDIWLNKL